LLGTNALAYLPPPSLTKKSKVFNLDTRKQNIQEKDRLVRTRLRISNIKLFK
jgi:hypothetical protein